jgi:hypothetical protein
MTSRSKLIARLSAGKYYIVVGLRTLHLDQESGRDTLSGG